CRAASFARFARSAPDRKGREAILKIHVKGKPLATDVDLGDLSKATIGFSGADLANLANEAALHAARAARKRITMRDFTDAFERIVLGIKSPPLANEYERRLTAFHEAGHALVAALTPHADPLFKITIVPRGQALGVTTFLPDDDRRNYSRNQLLARIDVGLGGRAAEQIVFGEVSTGAMGDIRQVTNIARRMVTQFGMSDELGLVDLSHEEDQPFLGYSIQRNVPYSDETLAQIDREIKSIISDAYDHVVDILNAHRSKLDLLAQELLDNEIVERVRVLEIAGVEAKQSPEVEDDRPAMLEPAVSDPPQDENDPSSGS
ncbi:MAG: ATP-dependent metallopeptidase FtsH/Yme1/Tma family protein, partial [Anaerolineae bacterium]|nr:ATP-dependent metallopeptidase FtsH/Yme1/Tma family protein [Anaerolineae bacterium]